MSEQEPGVKSGLACIYCQSKVDEAQPIPPCSHLICRDCGEGRNPSVVRVISPHVVISSNIDAKYDPSVCVFCPSAMRKTTLLEGALELLRCVWCGGLCQNAYDGPCGHNMCDACADYACRTTGLCPKCWQPLQPDLGPARSVRRQVSDVIFICKFEVHGCDKKGRLHELVLHEAQCDYREQACEACGRCLRLEQWQEHQKMCADIKVDCPHQCGTILPKIQMNAHASQCEDRIIPCDMLACDHHIQRRFLAEHQADTAFHLTLLSQFFQEQTTQQAAIISQQQAQSQQQQQKLEKLEQSHQIQATLLEQHKHQLEEQRHQLEAQRQQLLQQHQTQVEQLVLIDALRQELQQLKQEMRIALVQKAEKTEEKKEAKSQSFAVLGSHAPRELVVFAEPTSCYGVAAAGGFVYLADWNNHLMEVVDAKSGARAALWGVLHSAAVPVIDFLDFHHPYGVAVDQIRGRVYLTDKDHHRVVGLRLDGTLQTVWGSQGTERNQFQYPCGLAISPATGLLYVADWGNHCVKVLWLEDGRCVQVLGTECVEGNEYSPYGVAVDADCVYVADAANHRVMVYSQIDGQLLSQFGQGHGCGDNHFNYPTSVSVDIEAGLLYVADSNNQRVSVWRTSDGSFVRKWPVTINSEKKHPICVMWDGVNNALYVTVYESDTILVY
eukprot:TRINITY_DN10693_c0_g1_i4.p1 TRINITY_DN10693_c0_g1~~TRINITY_DN10693_c0_g1_i4.p1  ORF type:complete len:668 (+),score=104.75 TRINITY_DN10693_c0_g1_i4:73-2076(+)